MNVVIGILLLVGVVVFFVFQIRGLVRDIKARKARKNKNSEETSENSNKEISK